MCCCRNMAQFFFGIFDFYIISLFFLISLSCSISLQTTAETTMMMILANHRHETGTYTTKGTIRDPKGLFDFFDEPTLKKHDDEHEKSVVFFTSFLHSESNSFGFMLSDSLSFCTTERHVHAVFEWNSEKICIRANE